jgi:transcriptional regulator with XRE-family HTH domain
MTLPETQATDWLILTLIKELSGRLIERRRRRDRVSQRQLATAIGRSDRWLREIEGGVANSVLEDHIRCARALQMTTVHLFIPLLAMEHKMALPHELLMQDDLWELEQELLETVARHQASLVARAASRGTRPGFHQR